MSINLFHEPHTIVFTKTAGAGGPDTGSITDLMTTVQTIEINMNPASQSSIRLNGKRYPTVILDEGYDSYEIAFSMMSQSDALAINAIGQQSGELTFVVLNEIQQKSYNVEIKNVGPFSADEVSVGKGDLSPVTVRALALGDSDGELDITFTEVT